VLFANRNLWLLLDYVKLLRPISQFGLLVDIDAPSLAGFLGHIIIGHWSAPQPSYLALGLLCEANAVMGNTFEVFYLRRRNRNDFLRRKCLLLTKADIYFLRAGSQTLLGNPQSCPRIDANAAPDRTGTAQSS
jgi:hypothetical protein